MSGDIAEKPSPETTTEEPQPALSLNRLRLLVLTESSDQSDILNFVEACKSVSKTFHQNNCGKITVVVTDGAGAKFLVGSDETFTAL